MEGKKVSILTRRKRERNGRLTLVLPDSNLSSVVESWKGSAGEKRVRRERVLQSRKLDWKDDSQSIAAENFLLKLVTSF